MDPKVADVLFQLFHPQLTSRGNAWEDPYRLLYCSSKGDKAGVLEELENGVTTNLADYDKRTALHLASCEGCTEIVVMLLERGADVNFMDRWGRTVSGCLISDTIT